MSTEQHEALKLAKSLEGISSPENKSLTRIWAREGDPRTAAMLRTQHALIVQMADALDAALEGNEYSCIQGEWAWHRKQMLSNATLDKASDSHAAATQYLKGPKT